MGDERAYVSRLWAEDWDSPEDAAYDRVAASPEDAVQGAISSAALEGMTVPDEMRPLLLAVARGEISGDDAVRQVLDPRP